MSGSNYFVLRNISFDLVHSRKQLLYMSQIISISSYLQYILQSCYLHLSKKALNQDPIRVATKIEGMDNLIFVQQ